MTEFLLTGPQLYEAGRILGIQRLLLPRDPFEGWLIEEIEEALVQARTELTQMDLLEPLEDGSVRMEEALAIAVGTLGIPMRSLIINRITHNQPARKRYAHWAGGGWVWMVSEVKEEYKIELIFSANELAFVIKAFLELDEYSEPSGGCFTIMDSGIKKARQIADQDGRDACVKYLDRIGVAEGNASRFAEALALHMASGSIVDLAWEGIWSRQIGAKVFIVGADGIWLLESDANDQTLVKVEPISGAGLMTRVKEMVGV